VEVPQAAQQEESQPLAVEEQPAAGPVEVAGELPRPAQTDRSQEPLSPHSERPSAPGETASHQEQFHHQGRLMAAGSSMVRLPEPVKASWEPALATRGLACC